MNQHADKGHGVNQHDDGQDVAYEQCPATDASLLMSYLCTYEDAQQFFCYDAEHDAYGRKPQAEGHIAQWQSHEMQCAHDALQPADASCALDGNLQTDGQLVDKGNDKEAAAEEDAVAVNFFAQPELEHEGDFNK